jgi:hypothetical protein
MLLSLTESQKCQKFKGFLVLVQFESFGGNTSMFTAAPAIPDVGVLISATRDDASQQASAALIRELNNNGFDCSRGEEFVKGATGPVKEPFIYIHVLARPEGPQGEAKVRAQNAKKP